MKLNVHAIGTNFSRSHARRRWFRERREEVDDARDGERKQEQKRIRQVGAEFIHVQNLPGIQEFRRQHRNRVHSKHRSRRRKLLNHKLQTVFRKSDHELIPRSEYARYHFVHKVLLFPRRFRRRFHFFPRFHVLLCGHSFLFCWRRRLYRIRLLLLLINIIITV